MVKNKARIIGLGSYLPEKIVTNADLEALVDTSDEWIVSRTGMRERRIAKEQEFASTMGVEAAKRALKAANIKASEIDLILVATMTPDYISPSTATIIQAELKAKDAAAVDLQAACTGFLYGINMAKAYIESGLAQHILLIATEKMSSFLDYQDRSTCVLFGDGAAAAVISNKGKGLTIKTSCLGADGSGCQLLHIPGGGTRYPASAHTVQERLHYIKMNGKELFKQAVRRMSAATRSCLEQAKIGESEVSWLVPHQANIRIIDAMTKSLKLPDEKVFKTLHKYGNTSAASIAIALHELTSTHQIKKGENLLLVAFGAGLTWGATLLSKG